MRNYIYDNCIVKKCVDGDTFDIHVDLGLNCSRDIRVRLADFDTAEIYHPSCKGERNFGNRTTEFVKQIIGDNKVSIQTYKTGKYGRYIADIFVPNGTDSADDKSSLKNLLKGCKMHKTDLDCRKCEFFTGCDKIVGVCEKLHLTWPSDETDKEVNADGTA